MTNTLIRFIVLFFLAAQLAASARSPRLTVDYQLCAEWEYAYASEGPPPADCSLFLGGSHD